MSEELHKTCTLHLACTKLSSNQQPRIRLWFTDFEPISKICCLQRKSIILHCGTNDLRSQASAENIAEEIIELAKAMKTEVNTVFVSGLVARGDRWNAKVCEVNRFLTRRSQEEDLQFIDNSNITSEHLNRSLLHLNPEGTRLLANNFLYKLGYL